SLEKHLRDCGVCRGAVQRQALLWVGTKLAEPSRLRRRLTAAGVPWPDDWLATPLEFPPEPGQTPIAAAVLLALLLGRHKKLKLHNGSRWAAGPRRESVASLEEVRHYLEAGEPVQLVGEGRRLHLVADHAGVQLWAGQSPADSFDEFRVEFRRGDEVI